MKKFLIILFAGSSACFAGQGWYLTFNNLSNYTIDVTGIGGQGNYCWYSYDLDSNNYILPGQSSTIYTEMENSGSCSQDFNSSIHYQNFLIDGKYISIGVNFSTGGYINYLSSSGSIASHNADCDQTDTIRATLNYDGVHLEVVSPNPWYQSGSCGR